MQTRFYDGRTHLRKENGREPHHREEVDEEIKVCLALGNPIVWEQRLVVVPPRNNTPIDAILTPLLTF